MNTFKASHMHARITPRKCRLIADMIRGLPVNRALEALQFTQRRGARLVEKVLKSAVANAQQDETVNVNKLYVAESRVDAGPLLGGRPRWRPASRGRAMPVRKHTSHIHLSVGEHAAPVLKQGPDAGAEGGEAPAPVRAEAKSKAKPAKAKAAPKSKSTKGK